MRILYSAAGAGVGASARRHIMAAALGVAVFCDSGPVPGQAIYREIDAAGRVSFSDRPSVDAGIVQAATGADQNRESWQGIATGTRSDVAQALASRSAMNSLYAATVDFNEAARRLRQARQSRHEAMQSRPGEWIDPGRTSTTSKRYQERQRKLDAEIVAAQRRLHQTLLVRNARLRRDAGLDDLTLAQP